MPITSAIVSFDIIVSNMTFLLSVEFICSFAPDFCNSVAILISLPFTFSRSQCNRSDISWLLISSLEACELFTFEYDCWYGTQDGGLVS